jgi:dihydroorotase
MSLSITISITGGRVIDPANNIDQVTDLHIENGKVLALGKAPEGFKPEHKIDASNQVVCPGLIDLHARLREPGQENKATIAGVSTRHRPGNR